MIAFIAIIISDSQDFLSLTTSIKSSLQVPYCGLVSTTNDSISTAPYSIICNSTMISKIQS